MGCPRRISVEEGERCTVVICEPGDERIGALWDPVREPPAPFRLHDD